MGSVGEEQASAKSEDLAGPRVKFLCSSGGKILPRPQDGHLRYVGGETRMVAVNRNTSYSEFASKLHKLFGPNLYFKYQLPNEDLDTLVSVTCDEDIENMMDEYDKNEVREGSSRLRGFLFPAARSFGSGVQDFPDEPKCPDQKYVEAVSGARTVLKVDSSGGGAFHVPDFLFGLDPAYRQHQTHHRQQLDGEVFSPTHVHSPTYREPSSPSRSHIETSSVTSFVSPVIVVPQSEYSRQSSTLMETGMRRPAISTSALGTLMLHPPINQHMWDAKKVWDGGLTGEQRGEQKEERHSVEMIGDANYSMSQHRESGTESGLQRVSSKDRLISNALDGSPQDSHPMMDRHTKIQQQPINAPGLINTEKHKPGEVQMDVPGLLSELRQENTVTSGGRFQRSAEMQRGAQQANLGAQGYDGTSDRAPESRRNSGDSNQELHKRMDGQVVVDNVLTKNSMITDSHAEGFKYQDSHRVEENMKLQQQKQGDFEVSLPLPSHQIDVPQHMHLGKGHFQQVYWQARDPQEQQPQPPHETFRLQNAAAPQRTMPPPHTSHIPLSGATAHHHHHLPLAAVNTGRAMSRVDALPNTRVLSPLYRQAGSPPMLRTDSQQVPRTVSPLRDNASSNGLPLPLRYGVRVAQVHDNRVMRPTTNQQPSGLPVNSPFQDFSEPHAIYEQVPYSEKVTKGNHDTGIGQVHYPDKVVIANYDQAMGQAHYVEENLKANPQYTRVTSFQDTQVMYSEGSYPHQESLSLLSHH